MKDYRVARKYQSAWKDTDSSWRIASYKTTETIFQDRDDGTRVKARHKTPGFVVELVSNLTKQPWCRGLGATKEAAFANLVANLEGATAPVGDMGKIREKDAKIAQLEAELDAIRSAAKGGGGGSRTVGTKPKAQVAKVVRRAIPGSD